jgi:hypothetical protein
MGNIFHRWEAIFGVGKHMLSDVQPDSGRGGPRSLLLNLHASGLSVMSPSKSLHVLKAAAW